MSNIPECAFARIEVQRRNVPGRMLAYCATRRKKAGELRQFGKYEAYEDFENLFMQVSEALENETADTVENVMEGMRDALAATARHTSYEQSIEGMREWCRRRTNREKVSQGESIVYADLLHLYDYLSALYGEGKRSGLAWQVGYAVRDLYGELRHRLEKSRGVYMPVQTVG